jgi:SAM-dependent methyltransferase
LIQKASHSVTNQRIQELVGPMLTRPLRILDVGCGSGYFLGSLAGTYRERRWPIEGNLLGIDIDLSTYGAADVPARVVDINERLPIADASHDLILAIEVFEHSRAPYLLMQEVARTLAPGGTLIFSVPNVAHAVSRLSYLFTGHYYMYPTPSAVPSNAGRLMGHVEPLPPQYWHYGLRYAGFTDIGLSIDRRKKGATFAAALLSPFTAIGAALYNRRIQKYDAALAQEVRDILPEVNSFDVLTARSLIFTARKP